MDGVLLLTTLEHRHKLGFSWEKHNVSLETDNLNGLLRVILDFQQPPPPPRLPILIDSMLDLSSYWLQRLDQYYDICSIVLSEKR